MANVLLLFLLIALFSALVGPAEPSLAELVVPTPVAIRSVTSSVRSRSAEFVVRGTDADFRYQWVPDAEGGGSLSASRDGTAMAPIVARYRTAWTKPARLVSSRMTKNVDGIRLAQVFDVEGKRATLVLTGHIAGGSLLIDLVQDRSSLSGFKIAIQEAPDLQRFWLPYDPVDVYHAATGATFASLFLDWTTSEATRIDADGATYLARSDGVINPARERLIFSVSSKVAGTLPNTIWPRSRYYDKMTGRMIVDVTVTDYFGDIERKLVVLQGAGLSNCVVIVHAWQKWGYDNGLPSVLPPNEFLGGEAALKRIGILARSMQCDFALHQNYIDYYPNADTFDKTLLARDASGNPIKGWYNQAGKMQSYIAKPRAFTILAESIAPAIHKTLGSTAAFIDVNPSFTPWERVDMDGQEKDAGKFRPFLKASKSLFETMQHAENGPLLGEGGQHFYWTGALDGVEADMLARPRIDALEAPLWVDFDLTKIHPFQQNYGMGYYERFQLGHVSLNQAERDIYRTQQIAFGHLPYHSGLEWGDPRLLVQEAALAAPVARRYGSAAITEVRYRMNKRWESIDLALPAGAGKTVRVRYDNGLIITANTDKTPVADDAGTILPTGGWSVRGGDIAGYSATVDGVRRDFMKGNGTIYADPRDTPGNWAIAPGHIAAPVDFGVIRTNAQTWMRCDKGSWTIIGFAQRGFVDLEVKNKIMAQPSRLRTATGVEAAPDMVDLHSWRIRLASGQRYVSPIRCNDG